MTKSPGMSFSLQETELDLTYKSRYRLLSFSLCKNHFFLALFLHELAQRCSPSWSVWASHPRRLCRLPDALCQVVDQLNCSQHCFFYRASDIWMGEMLQEWWIGGGLEDLHSPPACNWQWEAPTHQVRTKPDRPKFSLYVYNSRYRYGSRGPAEADEQAVKNNFIYTGRYGDANEKFLQNYPNSFPTRYKWTPPTATPNKL